MHSSLSPFVYLCLSATLSLLSHKRSWNKLVKTEWTFDCCCSCLVVIVDVFLIILMIVFFLLLALCSIWFRRWAYVVDYYVCPAFSHHLISFGAFFPHIFDDYGLQAWLTLFTFSAAVTFSLQCLPVRLAHRALFWLYTFVEKNK